MGLKLNHDIRNEDLQSLIEKIGSLDYLVVYFWKYFASFWKFFQIEWWPEDSSGGMRKKFQKTLILAFEVIV